MGVTKHDRIAKEIAQKKGVMGDVGSKALLRTFSTLVAPPKRPTD